MYRTLLIIFLGSLFLFLFSCQKDDEKDEPAANTTNNGNQNECLELDTLLNNFGNTKLYVYGLAISPTPPQNVNTGCRDRDTLSIILETVQDINKTYNHRINLFWRGCEWDDSAGGVLTFADCDQGVLKIQDPRVLNGYLRDLKTLSDSTLRLSYSDTIQGQIYSISEFWKK